MALQWKSFYDESKVGWMTLNTLDDGFLGEEELLVIVNSRVNLPELTVMETKVEAYEDESTVIKNWLRITNIDEEYVDHYLVAVTLTCGNGKLTLSSLNDLSFIAGDGMADEIIYFTGKKKLGR